MSKAVSPVIATILLILIAIVAGVIIFAYTTDFLNRTPENEGSLEAVFIIDTVVATRVDGSFTYVHFAHYDPYRVAGVWDLLEGQCYYLALSKNIWWSVNDIGFCEEPEDE